MILTPEMIVTRAREYLGTPYHHLGRKLQVGVDCIGLVAGVSQSFGLTFHDLAYYPQNPDGVTLNREFAKCLLPGTTPPLLGDVLTFWVKRPGDVKHAAIRTDYGIIHTNARAGKVVEHVLNDEWLKHLSMVFRFPGVGTKDIGEWPPPVDPRILESVKPRVSGCCE